MLGGLSQIILCGLQIDHKFRIYYKKQNIDDIVNLEINNDKLTNMYYCSAMFDYNYKYIDCQNSSLQKIPNFQYIQKKLLYFNCSNNNIHKIDDLMNVSNIIWLNCSYNNIETIPEKLDSLEYFDFSNNNIKNKVDFTFYKNLKYLMASSNKINKVSNLPKCLEYLDLSDNPIKHLNNLSELNLKYLILVQTYIETINFSELEHLEYLDISLNEQLNTICLDRLPNSLIYLNCSQCMITSLNNLPSNLIKLICINNNIETLDMLPESLEYLDCEHNKITQLDNLPNNINKLMCLNNLITSLNNLPKKINKMKIHNIHNINYDLNEIQKFLNSDVINNDFSCSLEKFLNNDIKNKKNIKNIKNKKK